MIEVINRQRARKIQSQIWRDFAERALEAIGVAGKDASIVVVSDAAIRKLNRQFRDKDAATDVLSFPAAPESFETESRNDLGEIVISVQTAAAQAKTNGLSFNHEVQQLILHGLLHLCGYDHETDEGEMNRFELKLRKKLSV